MIKQNDVMGIGSRIRITEDLVMTDKTYLKGHEFTIIGEEGMRGWNIEDDNGNQVYETAMISNIFELIPKNTADKNPVLKGIVEDHDCKYSRSMHQIYPRRCIICGVPEVTVVEPVVPPKEPPTIKTLIGRFWEESAKLIDAHRADNDERAAQGVIDCRILIFRLERELNNQQ
jgi:hypothetical protein